MGGPDIVTGDAQGPALWRLDVPRLADFCLVS